MAIRLVHLSTGDDGESHFTEGVFELSELDDHTKGTVVDGVAAVTFAETPSRIQPVVAHRTASAVRDHHERDPHLRDPQR